MIFLYCIRRFRLPVNSVRLPEGSLEPFVDDFSSADFLPVIEVIIYGSSNIEILTKHAESLAGRIEKINGVKDAVIKGAGTKKIIVEPDITKLETYGISNAEIISSVRNGNISVPAGKIETANREFSVRTESSFETAAGLNSVTVKGSKTAGDLVRLGSIAEILTVYEQDREIIRYNSMPAVILSISKIENAGAIGIVEKVRNTSNDFLDRTANPEIEIDFSGDSTSEISDSIQTLTTNIFIGFILLIIVLTLFMGLRNSIINAMTIPLTFAATFITLEFFNITINTNTLFALVLAIGMIVDHGIVIIENCYRLKENGLSRIDAAVKGVDGVALPVITATLTTAAAFLPLMLLPGIIGKFFRVIPLTVTAALAASTLESLFFLPGHYADWPGRSGGRTDRAFIDFKKAEDVFKKFALIFFRRRKTVLMISSLLFASSLFILPLLKQDLFSADDYSYFYIDINLENSASRTAALAAAERYEKVLLDNREKLGIKALLSETPSSSGSSAVLKVDLFRVNEGRKQSVKKLMKLSEDMLKDVNEGEDAVFRTVRQGPPSDPPLVYRLRGDSLDQLEVSAGLIREKLSDYSGISSIQDTADFSAPLYSITVERDLAENFGISPLDVAQFFRAAVSGIKISSLFDDNSETDIILRYGSSFRTKPEALRYISIVLPGGKRIPSSSVAVFTEKNGISAIRRIDGKREISITADIDIKKRVSSINSGIKDFFASSVTPLAPDVELLTDGEFREFNDILFNILRLFGTSVFIIYLILGTQFKSYSQPFLIVLSIPAAVTGVIYYLALSGNPFSTTVLYAGAALAGIAVNDSIVLVSTLNSLREEGLSMEQAVVEGTTSRLRAIILTSVTTIAGLLPAAAGIGGYSAVWGTMAGTIIFGLLFSTIATGSCPGSLSPDSGKEKSVKQRTAPVREMKLLQQGAQQQDGDL
jgi:multidrug efflux pump subunit AcrB